MQPEAGMTMQMRKGTAALAILLMLSAVAPPVHAGAPADDLKQIEYQYYFRGKYPEAIEALQTFLARVDVTGEVALRAREFLAASNILSGEPIAGKDVFTRVIMADPSYAGPDPAVFKPEVIDVYAAARAEYASLALKSAPAPADSLAAAPSGTDLATTADGKPIYKKWWFYAGAAALVGVAVGVAAAGGNDTAPPPSGTIAVGVNVQ